MCLGESFHLSLPIFCSTVLSPDQASLPCSISGTLPTAQSSLWFAVSTADDQRSFLNDDKVDPHVLLLFEYNEQWCKRPVQRPSKSYVFAKVCGPFRCL